MKPSLPREGFEIAQIEATMETIKALGRVRVRGRNFSQKLNLLTVLCECREKVDSRKVPSEVLPEGKTETWNLVMVSEEADVVEEPQCSPEGRVAGATVGGSPESIIRAVGDLLTKMEKPSGESSSYRRLRLFSGALPTPAGEEALEHWLEHARLMVEESDCSAKEKRRRIMECLKGPALAVMKAARDSDPEVSPAQCLDAIESAFGSAETGEDLYFAFRLLQQQPKEKLSDFLRRLELSLTRVVRRGGLPPDRADRARVEQLLRGAVHSDMMLVQLKLREKRECPPSFLELLSEIRGEEEYESSRMKLNSSLRRVQANTDTDSREGEIQSLKSDIKELRAMLTTMTATNSQVSLDKKEPVLMARVPVNETYVDAEVAALKKQTGNGHTNCAAKKSEVITQKGDIPPGLIGPPSLVPIKVNVSGLAIWGLSDASYPYLGYVVVDMEFPENVTGVKKTITVLALICPSSPSPEQSPVILGTNVNMFRRLAQLCQDTAGVDIGQTLGIQAKTSVSLPNQLTLDGEEDEVGSVKWMGPGSLNLPPGGECCAICEVELKRPVDKDILMVEASPVTPLPSGVLLQPIVVPGAAVDVNHFTVLVHNESLRDTVIPVGTVIGQLCPADPVAPSPRIRAETVTPPTQLDPQLIQFGDSPIPQQWKDRLRQKLCERASVFSLHEWDVGLARDVEHHIRLSDPRPFRERSRRLAPADVDAVRKHLQELLHAGIIKESRSQYASPIVIARKKNRRIRMCIDYRTLNRRTTPDQYTTPLIDDALDCLSGRHYWSTRYIPKAYGKAVGDMNLLQVLVYLDDLIVFGRSLEEHEERLLRVLDRLEEVGLKLSLDKCQFCQPRVKYVGHIVSADGIATDPDKIQAVASWPQPTDLKSLHSFLGFCGYYRRFIANYSSIVRPLTDLTKGYAPTQRGRKQGAGKNKEYLKESEPFKERWDQSCTDAFKRIIQCLVNAPVLAFADPGKPYVLHTDASFKGVGAVLYQEYPEGLRPVAFRQQKVELP
ncbi:hypothetical protein L3Q82_021004 [Scortum barcoo]|uniref:Uncharacterized protein n=1 Tax=Scortum barcoo TaxID=214431 RepID=A0ACB8X2I2_9TELE|nr:hypothetical protein L3Q82_021004 [Scortum barcoo]